MKRLVNFVQSKVRSTTFFLALLATGIAVTPSVQAAGQSVPPKVASWLDAYQQFDLERFLEFYADNVSFKDPTAGITLPSKKDLREIYTPIMQGRWGGDFRMQIQSVVSSGGLVVFEGIFSLTFNGQTANVNFTTWLEFENGLIVRQLDMFDYSALRRQIPTYGQSVPSEYTGPGN